MALLRRHLLFSLTLLTLVAGINPPARAYLDSAGQKAYAIPLQEAILHRDYAKALALVDGLDLAPDAPLPGIVRMTILQVRMFENFDFSRQGEFNRVSEQNETLCLGHIKNADRDGWNLLLCGIGDGLRAFALLKNKQTFRALSFANRALDTFRAVKTLEPDNIDVDLAFALYDYFKSEFTETTLAFLPFFKDKRNEALVRIRSVSRNGQYARQLANFSLALIALDTENRTVGLEVFPKLVSSYPRSVLFRIMNAAFLIKINRHTEAVQGLVELMQRNPEITAAHYFMGRALVLEGKNAALAREHLNSYLATRGDDSIRGPAYYLLGVLAEREGRLDEAQALYQRAYDTYPRYKASLRNLLRLKNRKR